jgi:hypothetical protein
VKRFIAFLSLKPLEISYHNSVSPMSTIPSTDDDEHTPTSAECLQSSGTENEEVVDDDQPRKKRPSQNRRAPQAHRPMLVPKVCHFFMDGFSQHEQVRLGALSVDLDFIDATDRRAQIALARQHLRGFEEDSHFTVAMIGRYFEGLKYQVIEAQWRKSQLEAKDSCRPPILKSDVVQWMVDLIISRVGEHHPVTYAELLDLRQYAHEVVISGETLRHIVRNMPQIKSIVGVLMRAVSMSRAMFGKRR